MSAEEEQLLEQLKGLRIEDVILQTVVTLINVSGIKLTEAKDVEQAKKGIDAARTLLPLCPEEQAAPIKEALSQLQMLYVRETQPQEKPKPDIWTPPGSRESG